MKPVLTFPFIYSLVSSSFFDNAYAGDEEQVTFYTTYGYRDGDNWVIPMRVWSHERRGLAEKFITKVVASIGNLGHQEIGNFRSRIQDFAADSESREMVTFEFDNDPERQKFRVQNSHGNFPKTDHNGLVEGVVKIPVKKAKELLSLKVP